MNHHHCDSLSPGEAVHTMAPAKLSPPKRATAAELLREHHGRQPLRCDRGRMRTDLAALQTDAARRNLQPSALAGKI